MTPPVDPDAEMDLWDYGNLKQNGIKPRHWAWTGAAFGTVGYRKNWLQDEDHFLNVLKTQGPLWCPGLFLSPTTIHVVVAIGIEKKSTGAVVSLLDPYGLFIPREQDLSYTMDFDSFMGKVFPDFEHAPIQCWS
jgi:hypothetical protein